MSTIEAQRAVPRTAGPWSLKTVVSGIVAVIVLTVVAAVMVLVIAPGLDEEAFGVVVQAIFATLLVIVPLALISAPGRVLASPVRLGLRRFDVAQGLGWTFAAYGGFFIFLVAYGLLVQPDPQEIIEEIRGEEETLMLVALGILVVGAAPFAEEFFFRGFLFGGLRGRMSFWSAAVVSGILFGLVHAPGGPLQVPPLAVFGVLLAWLYERTGSLGPPIIMHMIQNTIAFTYTTQA